MPTLYPYQLDDARFLATTPRALLWGDPGVGKTATAVIASARDPTIVVLSPLAVLLHWQREFWIWSDRIATVVREVSDIQPGRILILNPDKLHRPEIRAALDKLAPDVLMLDESQQFKNPDAKRTKYIFGRQGLARRAKKIWLLSGTPCPQGPVDLYVPLTTLWPSVLNGLSRDEFIEQYHVTNHFGRIVATRPGKMRDLGQRLRPYVRRRRIEDCNLPPLRFANMPLDPEALDLDQEALREFERETDWRSLSEEGWDDLISHQAVHLSTLRVMLATAKAKVLATAAAAELYRGLDKLVVFSWHLKPLRMLDFTLNAHGFSPRMITGATPLGQREQYIREFQLPGSDIRVLLAQGDAGGIGVTLTAANECWFVDCPWTPASLLQAAKRLHRIGQTRPVLARIYTVADTIDEAVANAIMRKARMITDLEPTAAEGEVRV